MDIPPATKSKCKYVCARVHTEATLCGAHIATSFLHFRLFYNICFYLASLIWKIYLVPRAELARIYPDLSWNEAERRWRIWRALLLPLWFCWLWFWLVMVFLWDCCCCCVLTSFLHLVVLLVAFFLWTCSISHIPPGWASASCDLAQSTCSQRPSQPSHFVSDPFSLLMAFFVFLWASPLAG